MLCRSAVLFGLAVLVLPYSFVPAGAQNSCAPELQRIEGSLQRTRLNDATRLSASEKLKQARDAESSGEAEQCKALVQELRDLLHLDH